MNLKNAAAITLLFLSLSCATRLDSTLSRADELKPRSSPVAVGEMAPDFTLDDHNNRKATLSSVRGSQPTVLVFYRGNW